MVTDSVDIIATQSQGVRRFSDPDLTADGKARAKVSMQALRTLWLNTGTLCNLACGSCYMESSPSNTRLAYLTREDVGAYLGEIEAHDLPVAEIGITGGEPFMNPHLLPILEDCLEAGYRVLVLTNAMRPMMKCAEALLELGGRYGSQLTLRVSVDHPEQRHHEAERGRRSWQPTMDGLAWLAQHGFQVHVAGRTRWGEAEADLRKKFARLFAGLEVHIDAWDPQALVLFPEMDEHAEVPEITTDCWQLLRVDPDSLMCASSRMVVRRAGASAPEVVACTLLPYDAEFSSGARLVDSLSPVALNHPHCASFCVLGGASCSA